MECDSSESPENSQMQDICAGGVLKAGSAALPYGDDVQAMPHFAFSFNGQWLVSPHDTIATSD
jgi:hypothetical protein